MPAARTLTPPKPALYHLTGLGHLVSALYIGIYFVGWALLHSLLASLRAKKLAGRLFGETARRWYRIGFVLTAIITLIPLLLMILRLPDAPLYSVSAP